MMTKFLTREQTYGQLLKNVNENEKKLEELRAANDEKQEILNNLKINYENMKKQANDSSSQSTADNERNGEDNEEILNLKEDIQIQQKDLELVLMRKKNIHLVVDLVQNWVGKSITQLRTQMEVGNLPKNPKLSEQFKFIHGLVTPQLKEIIRTNQK